MRAAIGRMSTDKQSERLPDARIAAALRAVVEERARSQRECERFARLRMRAEAICVQAGAMIAASHVLKLGSNRP